MFMFGSQCFSWSFGLQGKQWRKRARHRCTNTHKALHFWDSWRAIITIRRKRHTWRVFFFSLHMPEKCRGTPVSLSAENMWQLRHSVWIQCTIQPSVETCHWVMGPSSRSHRYVLKHVGEELCWFHSRGGPRLGVCLCSPLLGNSGDAAIKTSHNCTAIGRNIAITVGWGIRQ